MPEEQNKPISGFDLILPPTRRLIVWLSRVHLLRWTLTSPRNLLLRFNLRCIHTSTCDNDYERSLGELDLEVKEKTLWTSACVSRLNARD